MSDTIGRVMAGVVTFFTVVAVGGFLMLIVWAVRDFIRDLKS